MKVFRLLPLLIFMIGCQARPAELNVIDNPVCEFPCWQNITPGITSKSEFLNTLSMLDYVDKKTIYSDEIVWQGFQGGAGCTLFPNSKHPISFHALFQKDKVVWMEFVNITGISLDHAIEILGKPSDIAISGQILVALINPEKGISFGYNEIGKPNWVFSEIRSGIDVGTIIFYDPNAFNPKINGGLFSSGSAIYPWRGYGKFETLYPLP
jgi:hypothetical protein